VRPGGGGLGGQGIAGMLPCLKGAVVSLAHERGPLQCLCSEKCHNPPPPSTALPKCVTTPVPISYMGVRVVSVCAC
jgi:hypothetical protein